MREINKVHVVSCLISASLLGCALGCGGVDNGTGTSIQSAPAQIAVTVCPKAWDCCTAAQLMGNKDLAGTDERSCEVATAKGYQNQIDGIMASEKDGRSKFDGDKLDACLATIRASSCETLRTYNRFTKVPGCDSFVQPLVTTGGACNADYECVDGWCKRTPNTSGDGACTKPMTGDPCIEGRCAPGFWCSTDTMVCNALNADGAICSASTQCQSGSCDATSATCVPLTNSCFYASGCSAAGWGRPTLLSLLAMAAGIAGALRSRRRARARV